MHIVNKTTVRKALKSNSADIMKLQWLIPHEYCTIVIILHFLSLLYKHSVRVKSEKRQYTLCTLAHTR